VIKEVNFLFVHGLKSCQSDRQNAQNSLDELESALLAALPARIATYQAAHPGTVVVVRTARANLYTATPSGVHPSDSSNPLNMDDWEVGDPGCSTTQQGDPCTSAYEWRYRLAREIDRLYPAPARNIVLVGHSAGGRVAMEVTANLGTAGVGSHDWGVQSRIAGVVSVQGVIDALGSSKYNVVGITSFETACKNGDAIVGFGESCAPGNGFCEYAGRVDGFSSADWVARNKRALMLTAWGSCSPSAWTGRSDGTLPYDAQASPWAVGLDMTPAPGETWRVSHGQFYGSVCHSAITNPGRSDHVTARNAARNRILDWLFVAAPRVANMGTNSASSVPFNGSSATFTMGSSCPAGELDDTVTAGNKGPGIDVVGVCRHPGFFDGDDHAVALSEFTVTNGGTCNGTYRWTQAHDSDNNHAGSFTWKTRSLRTAGPDLIAGLPAS
jgi:pimeloyl-ACP methyl ester carboxylesterase